MHMYLAFYRLFGEFSQKSRKLIIFILLGKETFFLPFLAPKSHFRWFGVPQTLTLPFKLGDTGSVLGDLLMAGGRPSRGLPSLKIRERSDEKWGRNYGPNVRVSNY